MNLKKIGSMLTSIAMIASLATYVPSVSASYKLDKAAVSSETGTGASVVLNQADFDKVLKAGSYEGTFYGNPDVSYVLDVTNTETDGVTYKSAVLTIKPTTEGEKYTIPESDETGKGILDLIAYDLDYDSANLNVLIDEYVIEGNCTGYKNYAFAEVKRDGFTPKFTYSCLADADFSKLTMFELNLTHNYKANAGRKNHTCEDCGIISKDFKVHDFKVASTTSKVHVCDCGATSEDFPQIHEWDDSTHKCKLCGLDNAEAHTKEITSTATTHTVKCKDCGMTLAAAESHEWAVNKDNHSHYCKVCGYVAGTNKEDARHSYSNIYVNEKKSDGTWEKVLTPVATGGMVCACGAIDPKHTHTFEAKNGAHMCQCGELESSTNHAFNYTFTGEGLYTVNGLAGFDFDKDNGAVCGCGAINTSHDTHVTADDVKNGVKNGVLFNKQHYCTCGQLIVDSNGDPVHHYVADEKTHQHKCVCGAVDENAHEYVYKYTFSTASDDTETLDTYNPEKNETGITKQNAKGLNKTKVTDGTGLVCECGAIKESHKKCDYTKADMCDTEKHIHYCACGSSSTDESVHDIDAKTNKCKLCGAYKAHDHNVENCKCTICEEEIHDYAVVTYKGKKVHQCQDCGKIVDASATDDPAHKYVADKTTHQHVCECGVVDKTAHKYGETGEAKCICQECGFENHDPEYNTAKKAHICKNCEKTFADGEVCKYSDATDKCECGYLNPMHKHAVKTLATDVKGNDSCRCGQIIAFDWELKDKSNHINKNVEQTVTKSESGIQTVEDTTNASTLEAGHNFDANGFCVCGAVDTKVTTKAKNVNISDLSKSYSSSYIVRLGKAASAVAAYDITDAGTVGANVSVAKTADEQAEFTKLLAEFNEVYAEMDDNKATTGYTVKVVGEGGYIGEGTDVAATKTLLAPFGEEVELVATAKAGYKFAGWYTDEACTTLWAADATTSPYAVKVQNGVTNIYAKFVTQGNFTINIPGGVTVKSTITNTAGTKKTRDADYKFVVGEEVTLSGVKEAVGGETFVGLVNGWGQICELNDAGEYTFTVSSNMSNSFALKSFKNSDPGAASIYVVFKNESQILAQDEIALTGGSADVTSIVPNDQFKNGYTFKGWADSTAKDTVVRLKSIKKDTVFVPVFEKIKGYTLTFGEGGRFAKNDDLKTNNEDGFAYGASVAITAEPMLNGKYFSGWYTEDGTLVSYKKDTMYVITGSAKLVPEYNGDSELVAESMTTFTRTDRVKTSTGQQFVATANWEMEPGVTVLEAGFVFSFTGKTGEALSVENADNKDVYKRVSTDKSANGTYDFTFSLSSKSGKDKATVNLKSFVTYVDASGETHTIYSVTEDAVKPLA